MISFNAKKVLVLGLGIIFAKNVYTPVLVNSEPTPEMTVAYSAQAPTQNH